MADEYAKSLVNSKSNLTSATVTRSSEKSQFQSKIDQIKQMQEKQKEKLANIEGLHRFVENRRFILERRKSTALANKDSKIKLDQKDKESRKNIGKQTGLIKKSKQRVVFCPIIETDGECNSSTVDPLKLTFQNMTNSSTDPFKRSLANSNSSSA